MPTKGLVVERKLGKLVRVLGDDVVSPARAFSRYQPSLTAAEFLAVKALSPITPIAPKHAPFTIFLT